VRLPAFDALWRRDPVIHRFAKRLMDARVKPAHDSRAG
jgi:hypothetical protein